MDKKRKKEYLKKKGVRCPYCLENNISADFVHIDEVGVFSQDVRCKEKDCKREWVDMYQLFDVKSSRKSTALPE